PPFLRFPSGGMLGDNIIIGGTYLSEAKQEYSIYSYNLHTRTWKKLDYDDGSRSSGAGQYVSWNSSYFCETTSRCILLGNHRSNVSFLHDYNNRILNFSYMLEIDVTSFGVLGNATDVAFSKSGQRLGQLALMHSLADMEIMCFDSLADRHYDSDSTQPDVATYKLPSHKMRLSRICVLSKLLEERWGEFFCELVSKSEESRSSIEEKHRILFIPERHEVVFAMVEWFYTGYLDEAWPLSILCGLLTISKTYRIPKLRKEVVLRLQDLLETIMLPVVDYETIMVAATMACELRLLKSVLALKERTTNTGN
ncbi:hypothetical protein V1511DRAFT_459725, partial [Dipodascopsis uninucleata]